MALWTPAKVLILVRTYPTPARKGIEVSCTAAATEDQKWVRLFPIPYRFMDPDKRFSKFQWIEAKIAKASDFRPESYNIDIDSIKIVGGMPPDKGWRTRRQFLEPMQSPSLCYLQAERDKNLHPTLGLFRPRQIECLIIEPDAPDWTATELARLRQHTIFQNAPKQQLEKIPFRFKYRFRCIDPDCGSHELSCFDWEMAQTYRSWSRDPKYRTDWQAPFRQKWEREMIERFDTHFFVGTVRAHPDSWIIIGVFYPPPLAPAAAEQLSLLL